MLSVSGLAKKYRSAGHSQTIFTGLDLQLLRSEVVALVGPSGCGKTTLLNLLSGIDEPDAGRVLIDGNDIHALAKPERTLLRRNRIGFVFQFFNLIPTLTVAENIALPVELQGQDRANIEQRVDELLSRLGLDGMRSRYPDSLSGGEQQRTAVARALVHRPALLLADEPTGNLDEDTGKNVIAALSELVREQHTATLIVTHSHAVAEKADRVLRLQHGELHEV